MSDRMEQVKKLSAEAMYISLKQAISEAGGNVSSFSLDRMKELSVYELMEHLGCNNIRFVYTGPLVEEDKGALGYGELDDWDAF